MKTAKGDHAPASPSGYLTIFSRTETLTEWKIKMAWCKILFIVLIWHAYAVILHVPNLCVYF